jgi:hypothetical protein
MKFFLQSALLLIILPASSYAQSNYQQGYVVTLKDDTLQGYIDNKDWDSNPTAINFKTAITDRNPQKFTVKNISFFSVGGLSFEKYTGPISTDITNINKLSEGRDTSFRIDTVFLQILQKGKNVAFYSYSDDIRTRFYIGEKPDYIPVELVYRIYYDNNGASGSRTVNENTYLKQLFAMANKYRVLDDDLERVIQKANYLKDDLMSIVSRINDISKSEYEKSYVDHMQTDIYITAGLNIFTASPKPWASSYGLPSSTSVLPAFSIGINLIPKPNSDKVEFRAELLFTQSRYASVNLTEISIVPQGIYNFCHAKDLKIYIGFGFLITHNTHSGQYSVKSANGLSNSFMFKTGVKFHKRWEIFANTLTFPSGEFVNDSSLKAFDEQVGVMYHFN